MNDSEPDSTTDPAPFGLQPGHRLVLASASASRRAVLERAGLACAVVRPAVDEEALKESLRAEKIPPGEAAIALAEMKALRISERDPAALVIGGDQLLVCEGAWFDKPGDRAGAERSLRALNGRAHELFTALVMLRGGERIWQHLSVSRLAMRALSPAAIASYLDQAGEAIYACVGAYQVEGLGPRLFDAIEGDAFSIQGLPLMPLLGFLRQHGALRP
ncbi:MAG: Maf-like protein [Alphaproteobacteria bacterium]|nr:Maf-like protein [Alphaproteobacteria bacterium]